ncbi:hypothetical protein [Roseibacillus ishigakijimensis]|uniref:Uncharacterized protein n=1 Tax=Roseibacillus ishigakijimensis TaxID=454146 RepID=A0A934RUL2_9BACT|nr:hypothetical protein [Roseibacillus ishigakijimensis]MBK1834771.1 hypothetical protein [Roseibacillus ishigakijimensis]
MISQKQKNQTTRSAARSPRQKGFSLIVTVTMLILLSLLAVGLLSLSSATLRSASHAQAAAEARANARMALIVALGELQKHAGLDTRVTARADILDNNVAHPRLTGVWSSREVDPNSPPTANDYSAATKESRHFQSWLVSGAQGEEDRSYQLAKENFANPIALWNRGTLGANANSEDLVQAQRVTLSAQSNQAPAGAMAWAVMDEGVKARINSLYQPEATTVGEKVAQLGSGQRAATEFIPGLEGLTREEFQIDSEASAVMAKGITHNNFLLAGQQIGGLTKESLQEVYHDVTIHSTGLLTNTARGGLRQDFHLMANNETLPGNYEGRGVYETEFGLDAPSDPKWDTLHEFSRLYKDRILDNNGTPVLKATAPTDEGWEAATVSRRSGDLLVNREAPPGPVLMPTLAKVQMIFSLIGRDLYSYSLRRGQGVPLRVPESAGNMHNPQAGHFKGTNYDFDLHLLYTPVVTLHNPYNVALEFEEMRIEFMHVPFAMQVFRNGQPQSNGLVPLETMYVDYSPNTKKVFGMNLKTKRRNQPSSSTFTMLPGETILFSPYLDPSRTYQTDLRDRKFWDINVGTGLTSNIDAIPGWRGDGIGFDCDWLAGQQAIDGVAENGRWRSCFGLAGDDEIHVEFAPLSTRYSNNKFTIQMQARPADSRAQTIVNAIEIDYEQLEGLQNTLLGEDETLRFPQEGTIQGLELVDHSTTAIADITKVKPFAMLSCQAKTTFGGLDESDLDGRLATKPWSFAHGVIGATTAKVLSEHPANHSHEVDLQLLEFGEGTTSAIGVDAQDRSNFITGHTPDLGTKFGALYEVPLAPLQGLAALNGANPGGSSGYLPRFAQPIGNSWAHPMLPRNAITSTGADGSPLLDHSFLLNTALYDQFYFSGFGSQDGPFGSGLSSEQLAKDFLANRPTTDPRLKLQLPDSRAEEELLDLVQNPEDPENWSQLAAWQKVEGAFNINSTSVAAWKAMLASVHAPEALMNLINPNDAASGITELGDTADQEARLSRFRLPLTPSQEQGGPERISYWTGPREYSDEELELLAEAIVQEVRERGPFLSLAEFVNRQLDQSDNSLRGALQEAIDNSGLNEDLAQDAEAGYTIDSSRVTSYRYENAEAGAGASYQGAPGYLSQADLLNVLGNATTARSDTFTIRGYGESLSQSGQILATATCEAVVQRGIDWLDSSDRAEVHPDDLTSETNRNFGRRFRVVAFRWLDSEEV